MLLACFRRKPGQAGVPGGVPWPLPARGTV